MRFLVQRVNNAKVEVDNKVVSKIGKGYLVLVGIKTGDTKKEADYLIKKLLNLRIFRDSNEKMNLSIKDVDGELLVVSQFTLYADTTRGNRPSFVESARPEEAENIYKYIVEELRKSINVGTGIFGADMRVTLENNGPVTVMLEKEKD